METKEVIDKLREKLDGKFLCPMCHQGDFSLVDGYFLNTVQPSLEKVVVGGKSVPVVAMICNHCGFVSQHALGIIQPDLVNAANSAKNK